MNELTGRAKGGAARALALTSERRLEIANAAVQAKKQLASLPGSAYRGEIKIGDMSIPCCVLADGRRLVSENGINATLGSAGGKTYRLRDAASETDAGPMPIFLASKALQPFIYAVFGDMDLSAVEYSENGKVLRGYDATILPKVCEVWLRAKEDKTLQPSQLSKAKKAEILMRGLAHIGIVALVDEATGYQKDREKDALAKILEAFVAKELQPYLKTFPADYYEQLFRLYGYEFPPKDKRPQWRPAFFGHITNDVVYNRLAPELLPELKKAANKAEKKSKLHQWLTTDLGHPKLREHLASIVSILKLSKTPDEFKANVNLIHPRIGDTGQLDFGSPSN
jgi:P63C domain